MATRKRRTVMDDIEQSNAATERISEVNRKRKVKEPLGAEGAAPKAKRVRKPRVSALSAAMPGDPKPPRKRNKGGAPAAEQAPTAEATVDAGASEVPVAPANVIESAERFNEATAERAAADVVPTTPATTAKVTVTAPTFTPDEIAAARKAAETARKNPEKPLMGEWHGVRWERQLYVGAAVIVLLSSHDKVTAKDMALVIPEEVMPYRELCWVLDDLGKAAQLAENMILKVGRATYSRPPA